jgi:hypothetical protein
LFGERQADDGQGGAAGLIGFGRGQGFLLACLRISGLQIGHLELVAGGHSSF